ncbi:hypothetical protein DFP72DRAFT_1091561 [Ephemerocybe angulata]|uniref:Uncharacterized protein n=1 Tax=Ephemerocybe angulata TaxID=980116 RepID=A0A8H6HDZ1_9AGAR|nr:hypothetical protein DFP72DRAFT_1091561 [Tulosesus angulatus]
MVLVDDDDDICHRHAKPRSASSPGLASTDSLKFLKSAPASPPATGATTWTASLSDVTDVVDIVLGPLLMFPAHIPRACSSLFWIIGGYGVLEAVVAPSATQWGPRLLSSRVPDWRTRRDVSRRETLPTVWTRCVAERWTAELSVHVGTIFVHYDNDNCPCEASARLNGRLIMLFESGAD